jgi:hypothetical protein
MALASEAEIKAEMRLYVLETLTALLWAANHRMAGGDGSASLDKIQAQLREKALQKTFPQFDAVESDLLSAEIEEAVVRACAMQREWLGLPPQGG